MKVVLLAPLPPPSGGIATWAKRMQSAKLKNGWKVEIVDEKVFGNREIKGDNIHKNLFVELKRSISIWRRLNKALGDSEAKVVHCSIPAAPTSMLREIGSAVITKLHRRKFIVHFRCTVPNMIQSKVALLLFKVLTGLSNAVIVLNTASVDFAKQNTKTQVMLIPNFISLAEICEKEWDFSSFTATYIGNVVEDKGCIDIIEAARQLPDSEFRLVGKVDKKVLSITQIPENVVFVGEVGREGVEEELAKANVFLFPSYYIGEGFSNSLAEAMAAQLPCIVTNWAANWDMIGEEGGFCVNKQSPEEIVAAIRRLKASPEMQKNMGLYNRNKVRTQYSQEYITGKYVDLYETLV
ncbi:MAG: glycosyltransferase family 4 protein [Acetatifactor sp.]